MNATAKDYRPFGKLIMKQIGFANIILLNKTDLLDNKNNNNKDEFDKINQLIATLNPKAQVLASKYSKCDLNYIFNAKLYDVNEYSSTQELNDAHIPETQQYGITSFVFSNINSAPSIPQQRLQKLSFPDGEIFESVLRSKGFFGYHVNKIQALMQI